MEIYNGKLLKWNSLKWEIIKRNNKKCEINLEKSLKWEIIKRNNEKCVINQEKSLKWELIREIIKMCNKSREITEMGIN